MGTVRSSSWSRTPWRGLLVRLVVVALAAMGLSLISGAGSTALAAPTGGRTAPAKPSAAALAADPGTVTGQITTSDGGAVSGEVDLYVWVPDGGFFDFADSAFVDDTPSPATYTFTAAEGDYYVAFTPYDSRYLTAYSGGASDAPTATGDPGVVHVAAGETSPADLAVHVDPALHRVTGVVTDTAAAPLADTYVEADRDFGDGSYDYVTDASTDATGHYTLWLAEGTYQLRFTPSDQDTYDVVTKNVTVGSADQTVDATLPPVARFSVSGTIRDASGAIAGADVELYQLFGSAGSWEGDWVDEVTADASGHYTFASVRGGRTYTVRASAPHHTATYLGDVTTLANATGFDLSADRTGADVTLTPASSVSGTVTGPSGPAADVDVQLYKWVEGDGMFEQWDDAFTGDDGTYLLDAPDAGTYTLHFDPSNTSPRLQGQWLGGGSAMPTTANAPGTFTITDQPTDVVKNATLAAAPVATGTITDQGGTPLAGASAVSYVWDGTTWSQYDTATTDATGHYAVAVPSSSVVTFRFARGGSTTAFYGGGTSLPASPTSSNSITTPASGNVAVRTVALAPFQSHLGRVAGQDLAYCKTNVVPANDDDSSAAVTIPFAL